MMSTRLKNSPAQGVWVSEFAPAKAWQALARAPSFCLQREEPVDTKHQGGREYPY